MSFSKREGHEKPKQNPLESMDAALKNDLWTEIHEIIDKRLISNGTTGYGDSSYRNNNPKLLWTKFFQKSVSDLPYAGYFLRDIEPLYKKLKWNEAYDLIEFILKHEDINVTVFNRLLEEHNASYRINNKLVQPISNKDLIVWKRYICGIKSNSNTFIRPRVSIIMEYARVSKTEEQASYMQARTSTYNCECRIYV